MNQHLQNILTTIQQDKNLSEEEKNAILKSLKDADKEFEITNFKLDRTEKVKRTTAILLEETIEELEHKRKAVEAQNRELEIESSLERVRAVAMGMMKADDLLNICKIQFNELLQLGFTDIRNALIGIYHDEKNYFTDYDYSDFAGGNIHKIPYNQNSLVDKSMMRMKSAPDAFTEFVVEGKELEEWKIFRKQNGEYDDARINNADILYYYFYSINQGNIGISTLKKISDDQLTILKRFRNVFDLAYRRYTDISNAETQAREARIETALERVRAVAMAMKKSEELVSICEVMYKELSSLGFTNIRNAQIAIENDERQSYFFYVHSDFESINGGEAGYDSSPLVKKIYQRLGKSENAFYEREYSKTEMEEWRNWRKSVSPLTDPREEKADSMCWYMYAIGKGHIGVSTFDAITTEQIEIVKRFKTVFELSYKRFDDLQKAEAQSREAQIQLALERVRARTMAMQKSDELSETAQILFQQFKDLGEDPMQITIGIINEEKRIVEFHVTDWNGSGAQVNRSFNVDIDEPTLIHKMYSAWKGQKKSLVVDLSGKDLQDWINYRNKISGVKISSNDTKGRRVITSAFFSKGHLTFSSPEPRPPEAIRLLERFADVFDGTYTRFLDLKNAEAQTRAAQVELAVERVRAKALAMHNSTQILEVVTTLRNEMLGLEIPGVVAATIYLQEEEEGYIRMWDLSSVMEMEDGFHVALDVKFKLEETDPGLYIRRVWNNNENYFVEKQEEKDMAITIEWLRQYYPEQADEVQQFLNTTSWKYLLHPTIQLAHGKMSVDIMDTQPPAEMESIMLKMGAAFDLAYKRFVDLQKSESQIREAQIELALERVRARTMAMQKSDELAETASLLFKQISDLGIQTWTSGFNIWEKDNTSFVGYNPTPSGEIAAPYHIPSTEDSFFINIDEAKKRGEDFLVFESSGDSLAETYKYMKTLPVVKEVLKGIEDSGFQLPSYQINHCAYFSQGFLLFITLDAYPEAHDIFKRFAKVFEQTYTRFLDLQKAEAQSRESQIQLALERARSQSMIMQHSKELDDTLRVFHEQVLLLGIPSAFSFLWLPDEEKDKHIFWAAWKENGSTEQASENNSSFFKSKAINYPLDRNEPATAQCLIDWKGTEPIVSYHVPPPGVENYFAAWQELIAGVEHLKPEYFSDGLYYVEAFMKYGCFGVMVVTDLTEDEKKILERFAIEFERTYRRFLDLQKAEAQAREAQIEAALEKVRSRSLAMHKSEEILEVVRAVFERLNDLKIELNTAFIIIFKENSRDTDWWLINKDKNEFSNIVVKYADLSLMKDMFGAKEQGKELFSATYHAEEKNKLFRYLFTETDFKYAPAERKKFIYDSEAVSISMAMTNKISIQITRHNEQSFSDVDNEILRRFTKVFDQSYTRFLDLQKAEAQTREAKIEASLERVRSKAMSMQKSEDLAAAISIVFGELGKLDLNILRCGIGILNKEKRTAEVWTTTIADNNTVVQVSGNESMDIHPLLSGTMDAQLKQENFSYTLKGADLTNYYKAVAGGNFKLPDSQSLVATTENMTQYYYNAVWSSGGLFAFSESPFSQEAKLILKRFADVFTLTYTRYIDLKQAEAQAKEAKIEVALERVRSRTLAMQRSDELAETAAVMFQQLITLGIEPNRLYIAIVKDDKGNTEFWITDEDGSKVSSAFETNLNDNATFKKMFDGWKAEKRSLVIDMQGEELHGYFKYLTSIHVPFKGGLTQKRRVQDIAYFSNGFIGMASPEEQPAATLQLLERFAYVFNLTFTRFNDLKLAEAHSIQAEEDLIKLQTEKKRAEDALTELRATQTQLIQSEKMASLGELTAGIAHEIQNPLNFVNNFSEVSVELIEELKSEKSKPKSERDDQLEEELLNDITQNLEKINHHGKRADAIVKGMLQHSRTTSSTKEPTDINKLADEYLRLAYHGLRAKDKSFNSTLKTDYDERIDKINVIPQDIGRVVLNLITNAFYAVKTPQPPKGGVAYVPTVSVSTKKVNGNVEVKVSDNGTGIPKNIIDKIFQPFFTTKPTGQGTGLGLSLAYDIVKAHGGELKVESKEGEGSEFIIQLPNV